MKTILLAFTLGLAFNLVAAEPYPLVTGGKPASVIITGNNPSGAATQGAKIMSDHLFQMSGAHVETIREDRLKSDDPRTCILIGQSSLTDKLGIDGAQLAPGEIVIRTFPDAKSIVLLGSDKATPNDPSGSRYAVTTFLEDQLGVRYLWPGELGKVAPKRKTIAVGEIDHRFAPLLRQRRIRMVSGYGDRMAQGGKKLGITEEEFLRVREEAMKTESQDSGWAGWQRLGGTLRLASGHSFGEMWEKHRETHPEWFAMAPNGSRDQSNSPDRSRLCVSNQDLIAHIARDRIERINKTGQKSVSIGPNDGGKTSFCMCEECKKLDPPEGRKRMMTDFSPGANRRQFEYVSLTDRYIHFFNGIAELVTAEHPDVWLTADAYSVYAAPPVKTKLHPNIAIRYVGVTYTNEEKRHQGLEDWHDWADAASKIYFRSNLLLGGRRQGTPVIYAHKLAEDFSKLAKNKMIGTDLDSCCHNWATQGLNYYVMAKLLWNPDIDIDVLIDDYCQSGFGNGADAVKRYLLRLEELTNQMAADPEILYTTLYTVEVVNELRKLLDEAAAGAKADPAAAQRVAFLRAGLEYTDAYSAIFRINREMQEAGSRLTPEYRERFRTACDRNWEMSREVFKNHHMAVNVTNVAWGSWAYFGRFGWKIPGQKDD